MRDTLGGYPYEVKREAGKIVLRFYPKSPTAKDPNLIRFMLVLDKEDSKKLQKI